MVDGHEVKRSLAFLVLCSACGAPVAWQTTEEALCPGAATLQGLDVYEGCGVIDWGQVADAGNAFAIVKATEGLTFQDAEFPTNWAGLQAHGLVRGAYHFFHPDDDGAAQADYFLDYVGPLGEPGDLPPVLDWEVTDCVDNATNMQEAQKFIDEISARTGLTTIIYTSYRYWSSIDGGSQFAAYPLWVASRGVSCPLLPTGWSDFLFWQYTFTGTVPGVPASPNVDLDLFNGSLSQLNGLYNLGIDSGQPADAASAASDASVGPPDASPDAGVTSMPSDAGVVEDGGQSTPGGGCGCTQVPALPPALFAAMVVMATLKKRGRGRWAGG
jgi:lysozyme